MKTQTTLVFLMGISRKREQDWPDSLIKVSARRRSMEGRPENIGWHGNAVRRHVIENRHLFYLCRARVRRGRKYPERVVAYAQAGCRGRCLTVRVVLAMAGHLHRVHVQPDGGQRDHHHDS